MYNHEYSIQNELLKVIKKMPLDYKIFKNFLSLRTFFWIKSKVSHFFLKRKRIRAKKFLKKNDVLGENFRLKLKSFLSKLKKRIKNLKKNYSRLLECAQLTLLYVFSFFVLCYTINNAIGEFPEIFFEWFPWLIDVFEIQSFKVLMSPEKALIISLLIIELFINRSIFNLSIIVKFNLFLILILEMIQSVIIGMWDMFFNRDFAEAGLFFDEVPTLVFSILLFTFFSSLYFFSYIAALKGKLPKFPGIFQKFIESIAFWVRLRHRTEKRLKKNRDI